MRKKRICCYCERWSSGGIEAFLHGVLSVLPMGEFEVDLVCARVEESVFTRDLKERGIRFVELSGDVRKVWSNGRMFRRLLRERRYDAVHLNLYHGLGLRLAAIARQEGVAIRIAHSHNTALRRSFGKPMKELAHRFGRHVYSGAATVRCCCDPGAAEFLFSSRWRNDCAVVPNGVDSERFRFDPEQRRSVREALMWQDCLILGNVGRLCGQKNQSFLLRTLAILVQERPDCRLLLVGQGEDERMLSDLAEELGIRDKVCFYGRTAKPERLYWAMDLYLLPSLFEGLPLSAVEAQAAGLAVIASQKLTRRMKLTEAVEYLPLSAAVWAETAGRLNVRGNRLEGAALVAKSGFDIRQTAGMMARLYRGEMVS